MEQNEANSNEILGESMSGGKEESKLKSEELIGNGEAKYFKRVREEKKNKDEVDIDVEERKQRRAKDGKSNVTDPLCSFYFFHPTNSRCHVAPASASAPCLPEVPAPLQASGSRSLLCRACQGACEGRDFGKQLAGIGGGWLKPLPGGELRMFPIEQKQPKSRSWTPNPTNSPRTHHARFRRLLKFFVRLAALHYLFISGRTRGSSQSVRKW